MSLTSMEQEHLDNALLEDLGKMKEFIAETIDETIDSLKFYESLFSHIDGHDGEPYDLLMSLQKKIYERSANMKCK